MKTANKAIIIVFLLLTLVLEAKAFTTNGNGKFSSFIITSSANNKVSSGNFTNYLVVGESTAAGTLNSANFKSELGFLKTTGLIAGDSCLLNVSCVNSICCNSICQKNCGAEEPVNNQRSSGGGSTIPLLRAIREDFLDNFIDSIPKDTEMDLDVAKKELPVIRLTYKLNDSLNYVTITIKAERNPINAIIDAYQYFTIESNKINKNNLKLFKIQFKVKKSSGYDKHSVFLNHFNPKWARLPTVFLKEDNEYFYYETVDEKIGLFAITGDKKSESIEPLKELVEGAVDEPAIEEPQDKDIIFNNDITNTELKADNNKIYIGFIAAALAVLFLTILLYVKNKFKLKKYPFKKNTEAHDKSLRKK